MNYIRVILIVFISFFSSCIFNGNSSAELKIVNSYKLNIKEPSGITYFNNYLFIVSDFNGVVYKVDLKGKIVDEIKIKTKDLEGITVNDNGDFFVVSESKRALFQINSNGEIIKKNKVKGNQKHNNSGLEGLCFSLDNDSFYAVNEKSPKQLLNISKKGKILSEINIDFAKDLSGICEDTAKENLWLLSDESQKIFKTTKKGELLKSYKIPVKKAEGIVVVQKQIYIVSDSQNKLYVFKKPN
ncbi:SdiA-regulated domain-containing protein [Lutibacter sp.]|uniref:SdiA-regulated domain-containing protein n=1 Tax=Lutibacter sp. TaxID=1925666 RepID=UPI001A3136D1|nr:SdiA-regulated domain-containing protein [Lutibacter sp.]MBI9040045.1 SdiA-regulated domain-containing protein [Lutibacter sp.]